jgi:hypothetical protein
MEDEKGQPLPMLATVARSSQGCAKNSVGLAKIQNRSMALTGPQRLDGTLL